MNVTVTNSESGTSAGSQDLLQSALDSAENFSDHPDHPEIQTDPENESDRSNSDNLNFPENDNSNCQSESMETTSEQIIDIKGFYI